MKILQVVPSVRDESSGPAYSVPHLCRALQHGGADVELHVLDTVPESASDLRVFAYPRHRLPHPALGRSPEMSQGLRRACQNADILHSNSLWMMPNIYPERARRGTSCRLVVSPRGTLAGWSLKRSPWRKKLIGLLGQNAVLKHADMFHATCGKEAEEIRRAGYRQPIAVIPVGIDLPDVAKASGARRTLLYLGRIHPVKGVDLLLEAWAMVQAEFPDWDLKIVGPDSSCKTQLQEMTVSREIPRVQWHPELNGSRKMQEFAAAELYILPSHTENFAVTVAEALSCGTPVIAGRGTPWQGLESNRCGWWSGNAPSVLADTLRQALKLPAPELLRLGANGRLWMEREFSWAAVGRKTLQAYDWLLHGGEKPEFIEIWKDRK